MTATHRLVRVYEGIEVREFIHTDTFEFWGHDDAPQCPPHDNDGDHGARDWWRDSQDDHPWHDGPRGWEAMSDKIKAWIDEHKDKYADDDDEPSDGHDDHPWHHGPEDREAAAEKFKAWAEEHMAEYGSEHDEPWDRPDGEWDPHGDHGDDWSCPEPDDDGWSPPAGHDDPPWEEDQNPWGGDHGDHDHGEPWDHEYGDNEHGDHGDHEEPGNDDSPDQGGCDADWFNCDNDSFDWADKSQEIRDKAEAIAEEFSFKAGGFSGYVETFKDSVGEIHDKVDVYVPDEVHESIATAMQDMPDFSSFSTGDMFDF